jgi:large subunit ribosomal protein L28
MSRCELTGKSPVVKNKVSHSNIKTKSISMPNVQKKRLFSKILNQYIRLQVAASAIRDMEHVGGFDTYVLRLNPEKLSKRALDARSQILRKMKGKKSAPGTTATPGAAATSAPAAEKVEKKAEKKAEKKPAAAKTAKATKGSAK